ncbi:MAG: hypothetical protein EAX96_06650 [Candidatus Lokiarchaeota archaeon]|nr:hypothetical protein [Candidatus Lokiarchaeota archaeon]
MKTEKCPHFDYCITPQFWVKEKEDFIKEVCKTALSTSCTHKSGMDTHFHQLNESDIQSEIQRMKEYLDYLNKKKSKKDPKVDFFSRSKNQNQIENNSISRTIKGKENLKDWE